MIKFGKKRERKDKSESGEWEGGGWHFWESHLLLFDLSLYSTATHVQTYKPIMIIVLWPNCSSPKQKLESAVPLSPCLTTWRCCPHPCLTQSWYGHLLLMNLFTCGMLHQLFLEHSPSFVTPVLTGLKGVMNFKCHITHSLSSLCLFPTITQMQDTRGPVMLCPPRFLIHVKDESFVTFRTRCRHKHAHKHIHTPDAYRDPSSTFTLHH